MRYRPHGYQIRAQEFIMEHPAAGLFLDMGLGKTVITLSAIDELIYDRFEVSKVLVIAPLRVAQDTWSREADKWDHLKHLRIAKILGTAEERIAALWEDDVDIYVINRENVVWLVDILEENRIRWPFDMVVVDELSSFKSNQAKRFKALRKIRPMVDRIVGLTGTPAANSLMDLWAEMYLLDRGERLGRTITAYRSDYFVPAYGSGSVVYKWKPRRGALEAITKLIADITVSMRAEDYLELPDLIESTISVELDDKARKAYETMERDCLLSFEDDEVTAFDAAAVMQKLLQLANGFVYDQDHGARQIHEAKMEALDELIEAADGPVLVYYNFTADRDRILKAYPDARMLSSDQDIKDWNDGRVRILVAHPASAGYGLNLQDGGHIMVWMGLPWSLEQYLQAVARLQRQGQQHPVMVYHILASGTVDEQVSKSLQTKDVTQETLLMILKERKKEVKA